MGTRYEQQNRNAERGASERNSERNGARSSDTRIQNKARRCAEKDSAPKKPMSAGRKTVIFVLVLLLIFVLILISPIFTVTDIKISAVSLYSSDEIMAYMNDIDGRNGFVSLLKSTSFYDLDDIFHLRFGNREKDMLFDYPLIKNVSVTYDPPHTINVNIEERTPVFVTEADGMYLYVDSEGYLLGAYTQENAPDMPVVEGIDINGYKIGTSIAGKKDKTIDEAIKICSLMKQLSMLSYIDIIDISDYNSIWMYCAPSMSIKLGSTDDIGRKLSYIKGIIDSGHDGMSDGTLDMSVDGNPVFKGNDSLRQPEQTPGPDENPDTSPDTGDAGGATPVPEDAGAGTNGG